MWHSGGRIPICVLRIMLGKMKENIFNPLSMFGVFPIPVVKGRREVREVRLGCEITEVWRAPHSCQGSFCASKKEVFC